ncbi:MAG: 2-hydroxyacyl-CoA dehydratase [Oscillospiraceae bacterium]|nr:2-hydroxyacyl-CoA dehydratase [Oscillospiraceae bacterium]
MKLYTLGVDVGSTTVKTVILDEGKIVYSKYQRHFSKVRETTAQQIREIGEKYPDAKFRMSITGSAGLGLANAAGLPFVQEVHSAFISVKKDYPDADCVIELGGEDAKLIFLTGGVEQRMNGSCAGGTGAFIDQMATLLGITVNEMDELSSHAEKKYPIASRCGVFAKSDIQPLINQGARREDIAASIFQAVVDQTVAGLAQGREIKGKVLFLGGPLSFIRGLRRAFVDTLRLDDKHAIFPENAQCFMAYGSALYAEQVVEREFTADQMISMIENAPVSDTIITGRRLFETEEEYEEFKKSHAKYDLPRMEISKYTGDAYLGIDAGSTTTKLVLVSPDGKLLYSHYQPNKGQPIGVVTEQLNKIYSLMGDRITIRSSAVTGYGEELIKAGVGIDYGLVETVAHYKAASFFCPDVDFIIDIGGQDMKCFKIKNHAIDSIMLNEACSSGCGSFIQTFAEALGYNIADFAKLGLFAERPVDLGSRCTVFMNSSVKQGQKDGASVEDFSAGLSSSIIKNAIYKVIRANSADELGKNIVVQGGTFLNDAVLRAFEQEIGHEVLRPAVAGLMGAFGAALYSMETSAAQGREKSGIITPEGLAGFSYTSKQIKCGRCTANCQLNLVTFSGGRRFISGNKCEKGAGIKQENKAPSLYEYKYDKLLEIANSPNPENPRAVIGIPFVLNFYEQLPFWKTMFNELGFAVKVSAESSRKTYFRGQHTIPSDTVCYPAKLAHGHIIDLLEKNVDVIFYPCETYNVDEKKGDNNYNCPVVAYYPELLKANIPELNADNFFMPYMNINLKRHMTQSICSTFRRYGLKKREVGAAWEKAMVSLEKYRLDINARADEIIRTAREMKAPIIVLSGRPYHLDPEINHGIHKLITSLGMAVVTEDSVCDKGDSPTLHVFNQWTYHSRLYRAAEYVTTQDDMELVQLVSFGCGIDAITTDEVRSILESRDKFYTQLKIDEISNLGAVKIRLRSLEAAIKGKHR